MKKVLSVYVVLCWLLSVSNTAYSKDCGVSCFHSEVLSAESSGEGCTTYTLQITADGSCKHALSHYSVGLPTCAEITNVSNSENWKIEYGTDPTSGISGFKVDDIQGFGEEPGTFTVTYTLCEGSCDSGADCYAPQVAYKAATCVYYEDVEHSCTNLEADLTVVQNNCTDDFSGSISVNIIDGVEPFSYAWSNGASGSDINNLPNGEYTVTITDATGETLELSAEITSPEAITIDFIITEASCAGQTDGSVDATISGGVAPYTFSWSNGVTSEDLPAVGGGYYLLNVTDANGCTTTAPALVENSVFINVNGNVTNTGCSTVNGSIDITIDGGTGPYTFQWSNGDATEDLSGLSQGNYNVVVTDANGCFSSRNFFVNENNPIRLSAVSSPTACIEDNSGSIDLTVVGGEEPYTFNWSNGEATEDISNLAAGQYSVTVTDATGCDISSTFRVQTNTFPANSIVSQPTCAGANDGSIELIVSGGTPPYTYNWSNGSTAQVVTDLEPGLYNLEIEDASGCTKSLAYFLVDPSPVTISAAVSNPSCEQGDFVISVSGSGGTAPYTFDWDNGLTGNVITALDSGMYVVTMSDAKGCTITLEVYAGNEAASCKNDDGGDDDSGDGSGDDGSGDDSDGGDDGSGDGSGDDSGDGDGSGDGSGDGGDNGDGSGDDSGDDGSDDDPDDGNDDGSDDNTDCNNPFDTEISLIEESNGCYTYNAVITYSGNKVHGLSHWTINTTCGSLSDVSNSENWHIEYGLDPTTGLDGFKVDDINGFGEGSFSEQFEVTFTICSSDPDCINELENGGFEVAYKFGQCVSYENVSTEVDWSERMEINAYPNPFSGSSTVSIYTPKSTSVKVEVFNRQGLKVKELYNGHSSENETLDIRFDAYDLPSDVYTYKISTDYGVKHGKIILANHN
ncbi:T9SS type A sorting domain-containing protein [Fulvivirga lutea]|uniref:T9SS type A sorting domain-containing protein n=1 Tax=Fulvivirga lutea TaxID=2810512 RepID=A0A974WI81_9BACT|nr:T9SS type A sorting domain-containing protein [Fulvivirga lutea]QSE98243.1 T9SS type A sorting domain-containing protein [Fulvivirga lutea]